MKGWITAMVLATGLGACAAVSREAKRPSYAVAATPRQTTAGCPLAKLPGVRASVADTPSGVAIAFTGPERSLDALRGNVQEMARANAQQGDPFAACPCGQRLGVAERMPEGEANDPDATGISTPQATQAPVRMPAANALVTEDPTGAVLVLQARSGESVDQLRARVRASVASLGQTCLKAQAPRAAGPLQPD